MSFCKKPSNYAGFRASVCVSGALLAALLVTAACGSAEGENRTAGTPETARTGSVQAATPTASQSPRPAPGTAWIIFGADTVVAEVARTAAERAEGLMYREDLPEGTGMLFIFERSEIQSFWMSNTYVALDIAFMDPSYNIVDIQQMEPLTTTPHDSSAPAMFALEVPQGWFAAHGIGVGARPDVVFGIQ